MTSIFISYNPGSVAAVESLARDLAAMGHSVWYDQALTGGQRWWDNILEKLRGLTGQPKGTSYELRVLARTGLLDRVVAIGDEHTDWALADRLLIEEGQEPKSLARRIVGSELRAHVIFDQLLRVANKTAKLT